MKLLIGMLILSLSALANTHKPTKSDSAIEVKQFDCYADEEDDMNSQPVMVENPDTGKWEVKDFPADEELKKMEKYSPSR